MPNTGIAIINTDLALLEFLRDLLLDGGYAAVIYRTGPDTFQQVRQTQPALIVLDVGTHTAAVGWPLLTQLRVDPQTRQIPILLTTVDHSLPTEQAAWVEALDCDLLELPAELGTLPARVAHLLALA